MTIKKKRNKVIEVDKLNRQALIKVGFKWSLNQHTMNNEREQYGDFGFIKIRVMWKYLVWVMKKYLNKSLYEIEKEKFHTKVSLERKFYLR